MELTPYLTQLGLDAKEIALYEVCLELGESPIMPITRKVKLPRSTVYHMLEKLADIGVLSIIPGSTRRIYLPQSPRGILQLLKKHRQEIDKQINSLDIALPELSEKYGLSRFQPKIKFYHGRDEIREIYESILDEPVNEFFLISEISKIVAVVGYEWLNAWIERRVAHGMRSKAIYIREPATPNDLIHTTNRLSKRVIRFAPADFTTPTHIMVFGDTVALITTAEEDLGVVISSRDLATTMRNMFKQLWKISSEK